MFKIAYRISYLKEDLYLNCSFFNINKCHHLRSSDIFQYSFDFILVCIARLSITFDTKQPAGHFTHQKYKLGSSCLAALTTTVCYLMFSLYFTTRDTFPDF